MTSSRVATSGKPAVYFSIKLKSSLFYSKNVSEELPGMAERFQKMKERRAHDRSVYGGGYRGNSGRGGNRGRGGFRDNRGGRRDRW